MNFLHRNCVMRMTPVVSIHSTKNTGMRIRVVGMVLFIELISLIKHYIRISIRISTLIACYCCAPLRSIFIFTSTSFPTELYPSYHSNLSVSPLKYWLKLFINYIPLQTTQPQLLEWAPVQEGHLQKAEWTLEQAAQAQFAACALEHEGHLHEEEWDSTHDGHAQRAEWATLAQEAHLQEAPCLACEHDPQGHPLPWVETLPFPADEVTVLNPRVKGDTGLKAETYVPVDTRAAAAAARRTMMLS